MTSSRICPLAYLSFGSELRRSCFEKGKTVKNQRVVVHLSALLLAFCLAASAQTVSFTQAASSPYVTGGAAPSTLAVYDFNSDGALDVIVSNSGTAPTGISNTAPNYTGWFGRKTSGKPNGTLGDFNGTLGTATGLPFLFQNFDSNVTLD